MPDFGMGMLYSSLCGVVVGRIQRGTSEEKTGGCDKNKPKKKLFFLLEGHWISYIVLILASYY